MCWKARYHSTSKDLYSQGYGLPSSYARAIKRQNTRELMPTNWCWRRLLRVPWTAGRSNRPILKGNQPWILIGGTDAEAEAPVFWSPDTNLANSLEKSLMLGKIEGRRRGCQRIRWLDGITDAINMNLSNLWEMMRDTDLMCCSPWGCRVRHNWVTEQQQLGILAENRSSNGHQWLV